MASRTHSGSRFGRRIIWLALGILVVLLAYTGGWFYAARALESRVTASIAQIDGNGVRAYCEEPEARGYPFRIGLFCRSMYYENVSDGISIQAGAFRSAANVYQPYHIVGEMDSPATVVLPHLIPLEARWQSLRASAQLADPLPERISVEGRNVEIFALEGDDAPLATVEAMQLHARRQGGDVEAATSFSGLLAGNEIASGLPLLEGRAQLSIEDGTQLIEAKLFDLHGLSTYIHELVIGLAGEEAGISLSGPVSIDEDGLIDAELSLKVHDAEAAMQLAARIFPEARDEITAASSVIDNLGDAPLMLRVSRGRAFLGFIPLGRIPPV